MNFGLCNESWNFHFGKSNLSKLRFTCVVLQVQRTALSSTLRYGCIVLESSCNYSERQPQFWELWFYLAQIIVKFSLPNGAEKFKCRIETIAIENPESHVHFRDGFRRTILCARTKELRMVKSLHFLVVFV